MVSQFLLNQMIEYSKLFVGKPYIWGGNGPQFDCSGFVQELLASIGLDPKGDQSSQTLHDFLVHDHRFKQGQGVGALLFYGKNVGGIYHVSMQINQGQMIEAGGGDSTTLTIGEASRRGAMVRVRPIRGNFINALIPRVRNE